MLIVKIYIDNQYNIMCNNGGRYTHMFGFRLSNGKYRKAMATQNKNCDLDKLRA